VIESFSIESINPESTFIPESDLVLSSIYKSWMISLASNPAF